MCSRVLLGTVLVLLLVEDAALLSPKEAPVPSRMDTSLCPTTDSLTLCQLRKAQCAPLDQLLTPPAGALPTLTTCANTTGIPFSSKFFVSLGLASLQDVPESVADQLTSNTTTSTSLRQCVLNATHLLDTNTLTLNRSALALNIQAALSDSPALGNAVTTVALSVCPYPVNYGITGFQYCLRAACMANVAKSAMVALAQSLVEAPAAPNPLSDKTKMASKNGLF